MRPAHSHRDGLVDDARPDGALQPLRRGRPGHAEPVLDQAARHPPLRGRNRGAARRSAERQRARGIMTIAQTDTGRPSARPVATPPRVFVIDDAEVMLLSCRRILEKDGYQVETFETGAAGLSRLATLKPQLLRVDLKMPDLDGIQVIGRIRELDPDLVIAVITGY